MDTTQQKPRSIRVDDQTFERFRELSASFENQGSALTAGGSGFQFPATENPGRILAFLGNNRKHPIPRPG